MDNAKRVYMAGVGPVGSVLHRYLALANSADSLKMPITRLPGTNIRRLCSSTRFRFAVSSLRKASSLYCDADFPFTAQAV